MIPSGQRSVLRSSITTANWPSSIRLDDKDKGRPGIESFSDMIKAYGDQDTAAFNKAVDEHLAAYPAVSRFRGYNSGLVSMERWMQSNWPTGVAMVLYLIYTRAWDWFISPSICRDYGRLFGEPL